MVVKDIQKITLDRKFSQLNYTKSIFRSFDYMPNNSAIKLKQEAPSFGTLENLIKILISNR